LDVAAAAIALRVWRQAIEQDAAMDFWLWGQSSMVHLEMWTKLRTGVGSGYPNVVIH